MPSIFQGSEAGQAVIRNTTPAGTEELVVTLHPGSDFSAEFEFKEDILADGLIFSSGIAVDRLALQRLVRWMREQGAVD